MPPTWEERRWRREKGAKERPGDRAPSAKGRNDWWGRPSIGLKNLQSSSQGKERRACGPPEKGKGRENNRTVFSEERDPPSLKKGAPRGWRAGGKELKGVLSLSLISRSGVKTPPEMEEKKKILY